MDIGAVGLAMIAEAGPEASWDVFCSASDLGSTGAGTSGIGGRVVRRLEIGTKSSNSGMPASGRMLGTGPEGAGAGGRVIVAVAAGVAASVGVEAGEYAAG
jgi:hypothetical protein